MKKLLILLLCGFLLTSCATINTRIGKESGWHLGLTRENLKYYPATKADFLYVAYGSIMCPPCSIVLLILCGIDLPISLTTDTLFLPFDIYLTYKQQEQQDSFTKLKGHTNDDKTKVVETYVYKNKEGNIIITDGPVPEEYKSKAKIISKDKKIIFK